VVAHIDDPSLGGVGGFTHRPKVLVCRVEVGCAQATENGQNIEGISGNLRRFIMPAGACLPLRRGANFNSSTAKNWIPAYAGKRSVSAYSIAGSSEVTEAKAYIRRGIRGKNAGNASPVKEFAVDVLRKTPQASPFSPALPAAA
jgi:hypothetical protein